jgi:transposase
VLKSQGLSLREIARHLGVSRNIVTRYLSADNVPRYKPREARPTAPPVVPILSSGLRRHQVGTQHHKNQSVRFFGTVIKKESLSGADDPVEYAFTQLASRFALFLRASL